MTAQSDVKSARRVVEIFQFFAEVRQPAALATISKRLGLPKSSCLGLLRTLESTGYLYRLDASGSYYPTRKVFDEGKAITEADPLLLRVRPKLEELSRATGETVLFAKRVGEAAQILEVAQSVNVLRYAARAGDTRPLHVGASGHALLAAMGDEADALIDRLDLVRYSPATIVSARKLKSIIREGAAGGWFVSVGGNQPDVTSIGNYLHINDEAYSITVAAPTHRVERRSAEIGRIIARVCAELGRMGRS